MNPLADMAEMAAAYKAMTGIEPTTVVTNRDDVAALAESRGYRVIRPDPPRSRWRRLLLPIWLPGLANAVATRIELAWDRALSRALGTPGRSPEDREDAGL